MASNAWLSPSNLFKVAAALNIITIPGHIIFGLDLVHPALSTIPKTPKNIVGGRGAQTVWNYANVAFLVAGLLNWQWSQTGGPRTREEKAILYALLFTGIPSGFRYAQVGAYAPLGLYWLAPALSAAALQFK